ncbi:MAG: hypothetical protein ABMA00_12780 [Gemmatimonas sp.]
MRPFAAMLGLFLGCPSLAAAQAYQFESAKIRLGVDSMGISLIRQGKATAIGQLWDEMRVVPGAHGPTLQRVYRTTNEVFGAHLDTTFVSLPSLAPLQRRTRSAMYSDSVVVEGMVAAGWVQPASKPRAAIARTLPSGTIDGALYDVAVRAAPLALGYGLTLSGYTSAQDSVLTLSSTVDASEVIRQRDGTERSTWRVRMDFGGLASTMWIDQETRALVKQIIELGPGVQILMLR